MGLPLNWLSHLPKDQQGDFESLIRNSTQVLGRLRDILMTELAAIESIEDRPGSYDNSSWAYKQAYLNGSRAQLKGLLRLFNFMDSQ